MRKALAACLIVIVFVGGIAVGWLLLRSGAGLLPFGRAGQTAAQRRALDILGRTPSGPPVPDTVLVKAAQRIEPAVVNIEVVGERRVLPGTPFERLYMMQGRGSGVIISPDGYIATNNHVVEGADAIRVTLADGHKYDSRVIGSEPDADLAVLKIEAANLPSAEMGDSDKLKVGEYVLAIGYPLGLGTTVTHGIISATDRENLPVGDGRFIRRALQTDAAINRGNSGGALANTNGQLIGINTAIASENGGGSIGIGFAIPVNAARGVLRDIIRRGSSAPVVTTGGRPFLGIAFGDVGPEVAGQYNLQPGQGIVVARVVPLSPADSAGMTPGNVIVTMDGQPIRGSDDFVAQMARHRVGDKVTLGLVRGNGSVDQVPITLGRAPAALAQ